MKKFRFWLILILSLISSLLVGIKVIVPIYESNLPAIKKTSLYQNIFNNKLINNSNSLKKLKVGDSIIWVELANTPKKIQTGLSNRSNLKHNEGMLFVLENKRRPTFWMKDMNFPLDIIWIDKNKIIEITQNVPSPINPNDNLPLYQPNAPVTHVLEVNAGWVQENNINVSDLVVFLD